MDSLRDCNFVAYCHFAQVIDERPFADRRPVPNIKVPGIIDECRGIDVYMRADFCTEESQQNAPPSKTGPRCQAENCSSNTPKEASELLSNGVF